MKKTEVFWPSCISGMLLRKLWPFEVAYPDWSGVSLRILKNGLVLKILNKMKKTEVFWPSCYQVSFKGSYGHLKLPMPPLTPLDLLLPQFARKLSACENLVFYSMLGCFSTCPYLTRLFYNSHVTIGGYTCIGNYYTTPAEFHVQWFIIVTSFRKYSRLLKFSSEVLWS